MVPKNYLMMIGIIMLWSLGANAQSNILRNPDGTVKWFSQEKGWPVCPTGSRLPTARELAELSVQRGSKIIEMNQVDPNNVPNRYYYISAREADGRIDQFYLDHQNYVPPSSPDIYNNEFWSSSVWSRLPVGAPQDTYCVYKLSGWWGEVYYDVVGSDTLAVFCVPTH